MNKNLVWKWVLTAALALIAVYGIKHYGIQKGLDLQGGSSYVLKMDTEKIRIENRGSALKQAVEIFRKRVDRLGLREPLIQPMGEDRILVQMPGIEQKDRENIRRTLERTAYLEFRMVHPRNAELLREMESDPAFVAPAGYQKLMDKQRTRDGRVIEEWLFVKVKPDLTGKYVEAAF